MSLPKGAKTLLGIISSNEAYKKFYDCRLEDSHVLNIPNSYLMQESNLSLSSVTGNIQVLCKNGYIDGRWFKYDDRNERVRFLHVLVDYDTCVANPEKKPPPSDDMDKAYRMLEKYQQEFAHGSFAAFTKEQAAMKATKLHNACCGIDRMLSEYLLMPEVKWRLADYKALCEQYIAALERQFHLTS